MGEGLGKESMRPSWRGTLEGHLLQRKAQTWSGSQSGLECVLQFFKLLGRKPSLQSSSAPSVPSCALDSALFLAKRVVEPVPVESDDVGCGPSSLGGWSKWVPISLWNGQNYEFNLGKPSCKKKKKKDTEGWGWSSAVEHLPGVQKTLRSIPSTKNQCITESAYIRIFLEKQNW